MQSSSADESTSADERRKSRLRRELILIVQLFKYLLKNVCKGSNIWSLVHSCVWDRYDAVEEYLSSCRTEQQLRRSDTTDKDLLQGDIQEEENAIDLSTVDFEREQLNPSEDGGGFDFQHHYLRWWIRRHDWFMSLSAIRELCTVAHDNNFMDLLPHLDSLRSDVFASPCKSISRDILDDYMGCIAEYYQVDCDEMPHCPPPVTE
jgi:hypothetical protein